MPKSMQICTTWLVFSILCKFDESVQPKLTHDFRFSWFLPKSFAHSSPPIKDHWRAFLNEEVTSLFNPEAEDLNFIIQQLRDQSGRWGNNLLTSYCMLCMCVRIDLWARPPWADGLKGHEAVHVDPARLRDRHEEGTVRDPQVLGMCLHTGGWFVMSCLFTMASHFEPPSPRKGKKGRPCGSLSRREENKYSCGFEHANTMHLSLPQHGCTQGYCAVAWYHSGWVCTESMERARDD